MEYQELLEALFTAMSEECYFEVVKPEILDEVGLYKDDVVLPRIATAGSCGADFFAPYAFSLKPGEEIKIATGVKAHCHKFTRLSIVPKSGLGFKYYTRLANTIGTVDADYYGNPGNDGCIFIKLRNEGDKELSIAKGEAFCQGIFEPFIPPKMTAEEKEQSSAKQREGGFGSTNAKA